MVVDDAAGLHRRVDGRRADEAEAGGLQALRKLARVRRLRIPLCRCRTVTAVLPHQLLERRALLAQRQDPARVRDRRFDLSAMAHDPRIPEQPLDVALLEARHDVWIEVPERTAEVLPFAQDRQPRETGLEAFEAQPLDRKSTRLNSSHSS